MRLLAGMGAACLVLGLASGSARAESKGGAARPAPIQDLAQELRQPLTLDRAIRIALLNQNTIGIAANQLDASRARETAARASYFPSIQPIYEYSNQLSTIGGRTGRFEQGVAQIGLRQLLFDMGRREENVAFSREARRASEFNVLDVRQGVIANVSTAYYDLLRRKELVKVAESSVERARTTLEATRAFVEAGTAPRKDIAQAQADYDNAQVQLIQARNDVRIAETTLKNAMGILTALPIQTPDAPVEPPSPAPDTRTPSEYLAMAFDNRPDLRRDLRSIEASRRSVKVANINAGLLVQADVTEGYRIDPDPGENRQFVTTFSYPLFDAGASRAQVREAKASLEQSQRQLELTRQAIQLEVEQAFLLREEARARTVAAQAALQAARVNYDFAREAQKEGTGTIIEVITAQTQLVTAETNAVQAVFDYYTSDARLRRAIGTNDTYAEGRKP